MVKDDEKLDEKLDEKATEQEMAHLYFSLAFRITTSPV